MTHTNPAGSGVSRRGLLAGATAAGGAAALAGMASARAATETYPDRALMDGAGAGPAAAVADPVSWTAVQSQLAAAGPNVTAPISGVVTNKYTPGMLLGNGYFGAVVGDSSAAQQTFHFGFHSFWGNARNGTGWQNSVLSAGTMTVAAPGSTTASGYSMSTDLATAAVTTVLAFSGVKVTLKSWTADQDSVLVTEVSSPAGSPAVTLTAQQVVPNDAAYPAAGGVTGGAVWTTRQNNAAGYSPVSLQATVAAATKLVGAAYDSTSSTSVSGTGTFTLPGGGKVTLVTVFRAALLVSLPCGQLNYS